MNICIYGAASRTIDEKYYAAAEELGRYLAGRGHGLVFGGGAGGIMGAVARGFHAGGAKTILGVAPQFFNVDGVLYEQCSAYLYPDTMRERKRLFEEHADAFLAAPGGIGTLDEFFEIVTLRSLGRHAKPVALYNIFGFYDSLLTVLTDYEKKGFLDLRGGNLFGVCSTPEEAAAYVEGADGAYLEPPRFEGTAPLKKATEA